MTIHRIAIAAAMLIGAGTVSTVHANPSISGVSTTQDKTIALGMKRGDGMGNNPGFDVAWQAHPKIVLGMAGYYLYEEHGRGVAIAPSILLRPSDAVGVMPFLQFGVSHMRRYYGDRGGSGSGGFGAVGVSRRFSNGISLRGGLGFHGTKAVEAQDDKVTIRQPGHVSFFVETGLRYWF